VSLEAGSVVPSRLLEIYARLDDAYRDATWHWYRDYVRGPMDIVVGAILVQHTTWQNAERALEAMRDAAMLDENAIAAAADETLVSLIRVSGTPTVKVRRLRAIAQTIVDAGGLDALLALPTGELRARLLATHGVGAETADAIALYAAGRRVFVIDAYARRMFGRIGLGPDGGRYDEWQRYFEDGLADADVPVFQRYHAYIVLHSKAVCRATPLCGECQIFAICPTGRTARD
jgi:endonuclease-3 related protein